MFGINSFTMAQKDIEQEQLIGYWVRSRGLKHRDLTSHPQIDDCILLIRVRDTHWTQLDRSQQAFWAALWDWSYHKHKALKAKHLHKLEQVLTEATDRHARHQQQIDAQRQRIKARRNLCQTQRGDDMMAKAPLADTSVPWEV